MGIQAGRVDRAGTWIAEVGALADVVVFVQARRRILAGTTRTGAGWILCVVASILHCCFNCAGRDVRKSLADARVVIDVQACWVEAAGSGGCFCR